MRVFWTASIAPEKQSMAERLTQYDSAAYLKTDEEIAMYLEACAAEAGDDPAFMADALGVAARAKNRQR
jgi:probable addiction module antidote protein